MSKTLNTSVSVSLNVVQPSTEGTIELSVYRQLMDGCYIKQKPALRGEIILPPTPIGIPKAWYMDEFDGQEWYTTRIDFSGRETELQYIPNGDVNITVMYRTDSKGRRSSGSSVGGGGGGGSLHYDAATRKLVAVGGEFYGRIFVSYWTCYKIIRYQPAVKENLGVGGLSSGGNTSFYGPIAVAYTESIPNQEDVPECERLQREWYGELDVEPFAFSGQRVEVAKVVSKMCIGANSEGKRGTYELPPGYPDNLKHDGYSWEIPNPEEEEDVIQERVHFSITMDDYSGVYYTQSYTTTLGAPYAPQQWENVQQSYIPEFQFSKIEPSGDHAKELFHRMDWDNIIPDIIKKFPGVKGV